MGKLADISKGDFRSSEFKGGVKTLVSSASSCVHEAASHSGYVRQAGAGMLSWNSSLATYHAPAIDLYPVCWRSCPGYLSSLGFPVLIIRANRYFVGSLQSQDNTADEVLSTWLTYELSTWRVLLLLMVCAWCRSFHLCCNFKSFKFWFFILPPPCSFNENPFLARALLAENSVWNSFRKLTPLEPTPFFSSEFLLIAIWLFLVSSSVCWVQAGEVHPAEGVGLCEQWGFNLEMFWHFICQGTSCWKLVKISRSRELFYFLISVFRGENPQSQQLLSAFRCEVGSGRRGSGIWRLQRKHKQQQTC